MCQCRTTAWMCRETRFSSASTAPWKSASRSAGTQTRAQRHAVPLLLQPAYGVPPEHLVAVGREVPQRPEDAEHAVGRGRAALRRAPRSEQYSSMRRTAAVSMGSSSTPRWRKTDSNSRSLVCEIGEIRGEPGFSTSPTTARPCCHSPQSPAYLYAGG